MANRNYFKEITGKGFDDWTRTKKFPKVDESVSEIFKTSRTKYKRRTLGITEDGTLLKISEEERESHMHIIGTTGEGKSKFLEYLIREDIDRGNGLCFFDPSENGDTLYKILSYCEQKDHQKVLLIDPHHRYKFNKIAPINPFTKYREASIANIMDTIRVLFRQKDASETPIIQRYLPAILYVLHNAGMTLSDTLYFTDPIYVNQRDQILVGDSRQRLMLEQVFSNRALYLEFQSTIRRLEPLFHPTLQLTFGSTKGIDFNQLIADGWVILVNLYAGLGFEPIHTRLLGTAIINELISSLDRLRSNGWRGVYYLYIDEAGRYANRNLADLLAYKRKSGLRVTLAHQYFSQFEDSSILDAVQNLTKIKVAFHVPNPDDRLKVVKAMYGGKLDDREVSYALSNLRKQHAVIKLPKQPPAIGRIPDVKELDEVSEDYFNFIYSNPVYLSPSEIEQETKDRVRYQTNEASRTNPLSSSKTSKANRAPTGKSGIRESKNTHQEWDSVFEQPLKRSKGAQSDGSEAGQAGTPKGTTRKTPKKKPQ
jgi:hypothetical protein